MNAKFDANSLLAAADEAAAKKLTELEAEVTVLGGQAMQIVREIVESIRKDDKASVADQTRNAEQAKQLLIRANAQLKSGSNRSEQPRSEQQNAQPEQSRTQRRQRAQQEAEPSAPAESEATSVVTSPVAEQKPVEAKVANPVLALEAKTEEKKPEPASQPKGWDRVKAFGKQLKANAAS